MRLLLTLFILANSPSAGAVSITKWQEKQALKALSAYCGNAWCEGDFDYRFKHLRCENAGDACELGFVLRERAGKAARPGKCRYSPAPAFSSIMNDNGGPEALNDRFLEALDDCFEKAETTRIQ